MYLSKNRLTSQILTKQKGSLSYDMHDLLYLFIGVYEEKSSKLKEKSD